MSTHAILRRVGYVLILMAYGLMGEMRVPGTPAAISRLRQASVQANSEIACQIQARLEAVVYGVDNVHRGLILKDSSGFLWLETDATITNVEPGCRVLVEGPMNLSRGRAFLGNGVLLESRASLGSNEQCGWAEMAAGDHPFRMEYFEVVRKPELVLRMGKEGEVLEVVPPHQLFHRVVQDGRTALLPGIQSEYFEYTSTGAWDAFPDYNLLKPVGSTIVASIQVPFSANTTNCVSTRYRGYLHVTRPGRYQFGLRANDGARFSLLAETPASITVLGREPLMEPCHLEAGQPWEELPEPLWAQVEGVVRNVGCDEGWIQLEVVSSLGRMQVLVAERDSRAAAAWLNARVRVTGLAESAEAVALNRGVCCLRACGSEQVGVLQAAPETWNGYARTGIGEAITNLTNKAPLLHVRGKAVEVWSGQSMELEDETGHVRVWTGLASAEMKGGTFDALGVPARENGQLLLRQGALRSNEEHTGKNQPNLPLLGSVEEVRRLSGAEALLHYPVVFRGVVTFVFYGGLRFHVQGESEGITVERNAAVGPELRPGDFCVFRGHCDKDAYGPTVNMTSCELVGRGQWPEPLRPNWRQLNNGSLDSQWVEVQGVVLSTKSLNLVLGMAGGEITARVYKGVPAELKRLVNAVVRVRGSVTLSARKQRRAENISVEVNSQSDITMEAPPPADLFALSNTPIADLRQFDPNNAPVRSVKVRGQILYCNSSMCCLQEGTNGLRLSCRNRLSFSPGQIVEMIGVPDNDGLLPILRVFAARSVGTAALPSAQALPEEVSKGPVYDATEVWVEGRVQQVISTATNQCFELLHGDQTLTARVDFAPRLLPKVPVQSWIRVAGLYLHQSVKVGAKNITAAPEIWLRSPQGLVVMERPAWWTWKYSLWMIGALTMILTVTLSWVTALRRRVELRTRELQEEIAGHRRTEQHLQDQSLELQKEIQERKRMQEEVERVHEQLMEASRHAGQSEVAVNVLHNVGNALNSVNVSGCLLIERARQLHVARVGQAAELIMQHKLELGQFLTRDEKGKRLPQFLCDLGRRLLREQKELVAEIEALRENIEHINQAVAMQQDYARASGVVESVGAEELLSVALKLQAQNCERNAIQVQREEMASEPVLVDKHKALQILAHVLGNAVKACVQSSNVPRRVTVSGKKLETGGVRIEISDNGVGIAEENLTRIFTCEPGKHNAGLGLHGSALAAKELGGRLGVESSGPNQGTTFILELPSHPPQSGAGTAKKA